MGPNCNGHHKKEAKEAVRTYTQTKPAIFEFSSRWALEFAEAKPLDAAPASPEGSSPITTPFFIDVIRAGGRWVTNGENRVQ